MPTQGRTRARPLLRFLYLTSGGQGDASRAARLIDMGFFSRLFSSTQCRYCGSYDTWEIVSFDLTPGRLSMVGCKKCECVGPYGYLPVCKICGAQQYGAAYNHAGCPVPKCPKCGHLWDADGRDD